MKKEYFSIQEAITWLSKHSEYGFSREDLLRANEKGQAPIYFDYKGNLGEFANYSAPRPGAASIPTSVLFPKPIRRVYLKCTLKSLKNCARDVETIRFNGPTTRADVLIPHKVDIAEFIYSDPAIPQIDTSTSFWGRVSEINGYLDCITSISESDWRFHVSDLTTLVEITENKLAPVPHEAQKSVASNSKKHKIGTRSSHLKAEIELAITNALKPDDSNSVWAALLELAKDKKGVLLGVTEDGIQYKGPNYEQRDKGPDIFTKKNLLGRLSNGKKLRLSA